MAAIIIGHSFVKRAQKYVLDSRTSMFHLTQFSNVFFHGIGGLKINHVRDELQMIVDLECSVCLLDVGSNDLCRDSVNVNDVAHELFKIANEIVDTYGVKVILFQQFNRIRRAYTEVFNSKITIFNRLLRNLCRTHNRSGMISCHILQNMWTSWSDYLVSDGTHLSKEGTRRLCRNYRTALIKASPLNH